MNYFSEYRQDGYVYTVDMIRLRTYISKSVFKDLSKYFVGKNLKYWEGKGGFGKFFDNWSCDGLWIGFTDHHSKHIKLSTWNDKINFTIEFNPNKLTDRSKDVLIPLLMTYNWSVTRFDLAIDIATNINNLCIKSILKKNFCIFYRDYNDKTYYFGKGNGHTKIYNKKIESGLDYDLTRYEVTKTCEFDLSEVDLPYIKFNFLQIYFNPYYSEQDGSTYDAILFALNNGFPFRSLSRDYKDRIKHDYFGSPDFSDDAGNCALHNCIAKLRRLI